VTEPLQASVDIILYPSKEDYISTIADFIDRIGQYPDVHITRNDLSPQLFGDYDRIMEYQGKRYATVG
jgi:hypothetical protein